MKKLKLMRSGGKTWGKTLVLILCILGISYWVVRPTILHPDPVVRSYTPPGSSKFSSFLSGLSILGKVEPTVKSVKVPILLYHYLEYNQDPNDTFRMKLTVTPYWFEKQLQQLAAEGYQTITLHELAEAIAGRAHLPPKPVILTFDDGYRDFYTDAYPLLKKYQAKATTYVVPDFLDKSNYMLITQLREIATESPDLVTIAAHTLHHVALTTLKSDHARNEIYGSKVKLERIIGRPVREFAYPYGLFNQSLADEVKRAGFETAVSTVLGAVEGPANLYYLPRIRVGNYDGAEFSSRLHLKNN